MRQCSKCKQIKDVSEFPKRYAKRGHQSWCKECTNNYKREYYQRNKDKFKTYNKKAYKKHKNKIDKINMIYYNTIKGRYSHAISNAKTRGIFFDLSFNQFKNLITKKCYYCGEKPKKYNGIDRISSNVGYISINCVPCCELCNRMKREFKSDVFLSQIEKIYNNLYGD